MKDVAVRNCKNVERGEKNVAGVVVYDAVVCTRNLHSEIIFICLC